MIVDQIVASREIGRPDRSASSLKSSASPCIHNHLRLQYLGKRPRRDRGMLESDSVDLVNGIAAVEHEKDLDSADSALSHSGGQSVVQFGFSIQSQSFCEGGAFGLHRVEECDSIQLRVR